MTSARAVLLFLFTLSSFAHAEEPKNDFTLDDFVTSYWFGPPGQFTTLERYREIKEANFTLAFFLQDNVSVEANKAMLDHCQKLGMKAIVFDTRMPQSIGGNEKAAKIAIDNIVKEYGDHPALFAYYVADEPEATAFPELGKVVAYLKERDPKHPAYINLLPTWARQIPPPPGSKHSYLGTATYEDYVREFAQKVKPAWLCYDNYGMLKGGDRGDFHENLATVRKVAFENKLPFWNIVLLTQHGDFRVLTEAELRFEAMQSIAYGARGVVWFTYWSPQGIDKGTTWTHAMINPDGSRDPHYDMVKRINIELLAMGRELTKAKSTAVIQTGGDKADDVRIESGKLTIGLFEEPSGKHFALLTNLDYKAATSGKVRLDKAAGVERFDAVKRTWAAIDLTQDKTLTIDLPAGAGVLVRW